jgi:polyketide biosynthesis acyl carrier protein
VLAAIRRSVLIVLPDLDARLITEARSLTDLGCNSIDRVDVVTMTMDHLNVSVPVGEFEHVRDIGSLAQVLRKHLQ